MVVKYTVLVETDHNIKH